MESTKQNFLGWDEISSLVDEGEELNPIDQFLYDWTPGSEGENEFRTKLFEAVNFEDEEWRTERNANVVAAFMEHCKDEAGLIIPESLFESFFNA